MSVNVLAGCEPYSHAGSENGVLVLHGFTGNPASMRPLAEVLAGAGLSVSLPRLPGHGTSVEDMMTTNWDDWSSTALASFDELAQRVERVAVVGLSMGGGLSAFVAERRDVAALVFINPLVKPPVPALLEGLQQLLDAGMETIESIGSDIKKADTVEASYNATPLRCASSLFDGVAKVYEQLSSITAPALLLSSREDHVVTSDNGDALMENVKGPIERIWLENSYHVATLDNDREIVESATRDFLLRTFAA